MRFLELLDTAVRFFDIRNYFDEVVCIFRDIPYIVLVDVIWIKPEQISARWRHWRLVGHFELTLSRWFSLGLEEILLLLSRWSSRQIGNLLMVKLPERSLCRPIGASNDITPSLSSALHLGLASAHAQTDGRVSRVHSELLLLLRLCRLTLLLSHFLLLDLFEQNFLITRLLPWRSVTEL